MPSRLTSRLSRRLTGMERSLKQGVMMAVDGVSLLFAVWAAYSLRLGVWFMPSVEQLWLMVAAPALSVPIFVRLGLYRAVVRYMGEHALWAVTKAVG
ncbi:polysaccharide biosynthesis protein, partial [Chlorobium phaeovibrioides]|nr:polysaccharide biosynthesis protein [Chlorobium phaeovibrioides]